MCVCVCVCVRVFSCVGACVQTCMRACVLQPVVLLSYRVWVPILQCLFIKVLVSFCLLVFATLFVFGFFFFVCECVCAFVRVSDVFVGLCFSPCS